MRIVQAQGVHPELLGRARDGLGAPLGLGNLSALPHHPPVDEYPARPHLLGKKRHVVHQEGREVNGQVLLSAQVEVQGVPVMHIVADLIQHRQIDAGGGGDRGSIPLFQDDVVEELLGHLPGHYGTIVGELGYGVIYRVKRGIGDGLDYPLLIERELSADPVALPDAGSLPEPIKNAVNVLVILDRENLHVLGLLLGGGGRFRVGVIDEPLVIHLPDDDALPAAAGDRLREIVHHGRLAGGDHGLLHSFLGLHHRKPGVVAGGGVHLSGVETILVHQFLSLFQPGIARGGDAHLLRHLDRREVGPALHLYDGHRLYRLHRGLVQAEPFQ